MRVNISSARTGEQMGQGDADTHYGLEHFGFDVEEMDSAIERLEGSGRRLGRWAYRDGRRPEDRLHQGAGRHSDRADSTKIKRRVAMQGAGEAPQRDQHLDGPF